MNRRVTVSKTSLHDDTGEFDRAFYGEMTPAEKVARAYQLSVEAWELSSGKPIEQRLLRHVARVARRGR